MKKLLTLLFFSCSLFAVDITTIGAVFDGEPDTTVAGCVNAQEGAFFTATTDISVNAIHPLSIDLLHNSFPCPCPCPCLCPCLCPCPISVVFEPSLRA